MDAFGADVLVHAAGRHERGDPIRALLARERPGVGSVLLVPELLGKPMRDGRSEERRALRALIGRLDPRPLDLEVALVAATPAATYRLRAADATHLATAVAAGADRLVTNNRSDFPTTIAEIEITYPETLVA